MHKLQKLLLFLLVILHVHVIPAENIIIVYTGVDVISFDPRPTVTKWQFIQACADAGITETQIDTAVALLTNKRQRFWKYTQILDRDNPFLLIFVLT